MTARNSIICDGCGFDLTDTGNSIGYRIEVRSEALPTRGGCLTDMLITPPLIGGPYHFCGLQCLDKWRADSPGQH